MARISLRTLLVLVTILCLWFGKISADARKQTKAVSWVSDHLGSVRYDWQLAKQTEPNGPRWLRTCLGDVYFQTPKQVWITDVDIDDLTPLAELTELEAVTLIDNHLRDISPLSNLKKLRSLDLSDNDIQDISPLRGLKELEFLDLENNPIASQRSQWSIIESMNRLGAPQREKTQVNMHTRPVFR
jgi:hypothetical protein